MPIDAQAFEAKIDRNGNHQSSHVTGACWEWQGARLPRGYGRVYLTETTVGRREEYAHRVAWALANGPIPKGLHVLHHCDNPPCVRPSHLFIGTRSDNMTDCAQKGRLKQFAGAGEANPRATTNWETVRQIRTEVRTERRRDTAKRFGITEAALSDILNNKTWHDPNYKPTRTEWRMRGADNRNTKLNPDRVHKMRELREAGMTYDAIAKRLRVTVSCVNHVINGRTWKHLP